MQRTNHQSQSGTPLFWGLGIALILAIVSSFWHGAAELWWHIGTLGSVLAIWLMVRHDLFRLQQWLPSLIALYPLFILMCALVASQLGGSFGWAGGYRVDLIFGNPNLLAASVVTAMLGSLVLRPQPPRLAVALAQVSGVLALLATASRTGVLALITGYVLYILTYRWGHSTKPPSHRPRNFRRAVVAAALFVLVAAVALFTIQSEPRNRLALSGNFGHDAWRVASGAQFEVQELSGTGPSRGTAARIAGVSSESGLIFHQSIGRSQEGETYVGSVYVRSDRPQVLVLGTNLSQGSSSCDVGPSWTRCVTPKGLGNNRTSAQLRLGTDNPDAPFDFYIWGAQLEFGSTPTESQQRTIWQWRLTRLFAAIDLKDLRANATIDGRVAARTTAIALFAEAPWFGVGISQMQAACWAPQVPERGTCYGHAHNLVLNLLAEGGAFGFLVWLLPMGGGLLTLKLNSFWRTSPLIAGVLVLNSFDVSYYNAGVYYLYWAVLAWMSARDT